MQIKWSVTASRLSIDNSRIHTKRKKFPLKKGKTTLNLSRRKGSEKEREKKTEKSKIIYCCKTNANKGI